MIKADSTVQSVGVGYRRHAAAAPGEGESLVRFPVVTDQSVDRGQHMSHGHSTDREM